MAPYTAAQSSIYLRVVTQRLSTTPTRQLPYIASYLAASIKESKPVFEVSQGNEDGLDTSVFIHKFKTQLSALLQDRSPEARFSAVILIRATVEVGGWSVLQGVGPWIRGLIAIIGRPDPPATKILCITVLTRIFLLTHGHQSLTREVTTPSLAAFVAACLNLMKQPSSSQTNQSSSLLSVLQAFSELITLHPSTFRPFVQQIQTLVLPLIAPTPSDMGSAERTSTTSEPLSGIARRLFVLLHVCAPKNTAGEEWARSLQLIIVSSQRTADRIFRSLVEDWRPRTDRTDGAGLAMSETVCDGNPQPLNLPGWTGIYAGVERLNGLLCTLQAFLSSRSSTAVVLPVSSIINLTERVLSILQPSAAGGSRIRPEIGRDEREGLGIALPELHVSAMAILSLLISRMGSGFAAMKESSLEQVSWVLENESANVKVRRAAYEVVTQILMRFGLSLPASCTAPISLCIRACCEDLLPPEETSARDREGSALNNKIPSDSNSSSSTNANSYLNSAETRRSVSTGSDKATQAAEKILPLAFTNLPSGFLSYALRARIDRTGILTANRTAMLASIMNPYVGKKGKQSNVSILPLLTRAHSGALEIEALLRPQMPTVQSGRTTGEEGTFEEEEDLQNYNRGFQDTLRPDASGFGSNDLSDRIVKGRSSIAGASDRPDEAEEIPATATDGADFAQPGLSMLNSQGSHIPKKRDWENDAAVEAETSKVDVTTADKTIQREEATSSKRPRLTNSEPEQYQREAMTPDDVAGHSSQIPKPASPKPSMIQATGGEGAKVPDDRADSDESDFEMPTLCMDPPTDEEDEGVGGDDE